MSAETPLWITISGIIFGSGVGVTAITKYHDWLAKKREETADMAKYRMTRVDKKFNDYIDLTNYTNQIASFSERFDKDDHLNNAKLFLSLLRFCEVHEKLITKGDLLLTDLDAESVIGELSHDLAVKIRNMFKSDEKNYWRFRDLNSLRSVTNMLEETQNSSSVYHTYCKEIVDWFEANKNVSTKKDIELIGHSIDELLLYEMNLIYKIWYENNKFVPSRFLTDKTKKYISEEYKFRKGKLGIAYPKYCTKITS